MKDEILSLCERMTRRAAPCLAAFALACTTMATAGAAENRMALPISLAPPGLRLNQAASHALSLDDVAQIAGQATAQAFRGDGWRAGYEERLDGVTQEETTRGCRVLLDAFVFDTNLHTSMARVVWSASTPGAQTVITHLPTSAQSFQDLVRAPGTPGWEVQIIFRVARTFADTDARCAGTDEATRLRARALAARVTRSYDAWIAAHPPS